MLSCSDVNKKLTDLVEGELSLRARMAVRMHLLLCSNCRRFARNFKVLVASLAGRSRVPAQETPPEFVHKTLQILDNTGTFGDAAERDD